MIARALRLRRPFEFERVRKKGRSRTTRLVVLVLLPNELGHNRYGFAVGRRVGKAARRNRVKRWLREAVRPLNPHLRQGYDIVFIARGPMADPSVTFDQVTEAVDALCQRAGLLKGNAADPPGETEQRSEM